MIAWHVCSLKKLEKYVKTGFIVPPVRAWRTIAQAQRMSLSTGRRLILRLKLTQYQQLEGHYGEAVVSHQPVKIKGV